MEKKLDSLIGETFMYNTRMITFKGYILKNEVAILKTNQGDIELHPDKLQAFLDDLLPVEDGSTEIAKINATQVAMQDQQVSLSSIRQKLMASWEKVESDPAYVNQAKSIANHANTIINSMKLEFQVLKEMKK